MEPVPMSPVAARRREAFLGAAGSSLPPQLQRFVATKKTVEGIVVGNPSCSHSTTRLQAFDGKWLKLQGKKVVTQKGLLNGSKPQPSFDFVVGVSLKAHRADS